MHNSNDHSLTGSWNQCKDSEICILREILYFSLTVHDAIHLAQDRDAWRRSIAKLLLRDPAGASPMH